MSHPQEGDILAGKYRIERVLGVGGMGMVVSALHLQLDEQVAIKFLLPEALANPEAVARFAREARAAVKIRSEHVARVTDVGALESGAPYMVMELMRGRDLAVALREAGPLSPWLAALYVLQACEALAEAHALGMVHRDLKPANLFLTSRADGSPCVKVLDFGISKLTNPGSSGTDMGMTRTQTIMGSPLYMSPEQMASARDVDPRSDIWAVGTVLYELVTGRVPFEAENVPQLCALILHGEPMPPRALRPDLPEGFQSVILRCLRKDRAQRYSNVAELAVDLAAYAPDAGPRSAERISRVLSGSGFAATELASSQFPSHSAASNTASSQSWGVTPVTRSRRAVWLVTSGVLAAGGVALLLLILKAQSVAPEVAPDVSSASSAGSRAEESRAAATPPEAPAAVVPVPVVSVPPTPSAPSSGPSVALSATRGAASLPPQPFKPKTVESATPSVRPAPLEPAQDPLSDRH